MIKRTFIKSFSVEAIQIQTLSVYTKSAFWNTSKVIFWGILLYLCFAFFIPKWEALQLSQRLETISVGWLLAAGSVTVMHYVSIGVLWGLLLRLLGARPAPFFLFRAFTLSQLPKYIPGKIVAHGVRTRLTLQAGVPIKTVVASLLWEAVLGVSSAGAVSLLGLLYHLPAFFLSSLGWLLTAVGAGLALLISTRLLGSRWMAWTGLSQLAEQPLAVLGLFGLYTSTWFIAGLSHWCLANALTSLPAKTFLPLTIAAALSWGLGVISVIAPAGLGIREGLLYFFVQGWMGEGEAVLFVTLSRLMMLGAEVLITVTYGLASAITHRGR